MNLDVMRNVVEVFKGELPQDNFELGEAIRQEEIRESRRQNQPYDGTYHPETQWGVAFQNPQLLGKATLLHIKLCGGFREASKRKMMEEDAIIE